MSGVIDSIEREQLQRRPRFDPGDRVKVHFQVVEGTRRRTQVFDGVVIRRQGSGARETFTVRKHSFGVGVERTFPVHSPKVERIEVVARGDVRRAKLYYLRERVGRRARVRERQHAGIVDEAFEMADTAGVQQEAGVVADEAGAAEPGAEGAADAPAAAGEAAESEAEASAEPAEAEADAGEPGQAAEAEPQPEPAEEEPDRE